VALIYTHSHTDHFGGARGVVDPKDVESGKVKVIAPQGFLKEAPQKGILRGDGLASNFGLGVPLDHPTEEEAQKQAREVAH